MVRRIRGMIGDIRRRRQIPTRVLAGLSVVALWVMAAGGLAAQDTEDPAALSPPDEAADVRTARACSAPCPSLATQSQAETVEPRVRRWRARSAPLGPDAVAGRHDAAWSAQGHGAHYDVYLGPIVIDPAGRVRGPSVIVAPSWCGGGRPPCAAPWAPGFERGRHDGEPAPMDTPAP